MEKNEIKKQLYKQKPIAAFDKIVAKHAYWKTKILDGEKEVELAFSVPFDDMGETLFENQIPAQILIRWLV